MYLGYVPQLIGEYEDDEICYFLLVISWQLLSLGAEWIQPNYSKKGYLVPSSDYMPMFPKDHGAHRAYGLEWWYWIGHLQTVDRKKEIWVSVDRFSVGG